MNERRQRNENLGIGCTETQTVTGGQPDILAHLFFQDDDRQQEIQKVLSGFSIKEIFDNLYQRPDLSQIQTPLVVTLDQQTNPSSIVGGLIKSGVDAYKNGQVAILILAGGQGTRLGYEGPKGCFPIEELGKSIFQIHFEHILRTESKYETKLPIVILTSDHTDQHTREFFQAYNFFGVKPEQVTFVKQGNLPCFQSGTRTLLPNAEGTLLMSPNGHGGFLKAIADSGTLATLRKQGVKVIKLAQIDNILTDYDTPASIGCTISCSLAAITNVFAKEFAAEEVGNYVKIGDHHAIIEYSELRDQACNQSMLASFMASSGEHIFSLDFLDQHSTTQLPYHLAREKSASWLDPRTRQLVSGKVDKVELFNFDLLPLSTRTLAWEIDRSVSFAAIKRPTGPNSLETAVKLYRQYFSH